ncbi:hypothetical protein MKZ38_001574 [Zalerion maritima]|uniref:Zn(2)-C6 fungal-type domain-containing protein n=1 Tax=Zalerion maritima TaxID=339359 RepID=A0AAD5WT37_9PEZI|nr:hypothetical protein MKZ38_001574 [Zalerion maritima]
MASNTPSAVPLPLQKPTRILACVLCQHRKIKCDRNTPCSNCVKANVACQPSKPAPPRKRRRPNQDLQERLARCEELLKEYAASSTGVKSSPTASSAASPTPSTIHSPDDYLKRSTPRLVQEKGNMRFMDNPLWSHLYDELQSMREILDSQDEETTPSDAPTPNTDTEDMLFGDSPGVDLDGLHPDPVNVFRLWHTFLERVNPLTKVIHVPTMQPYFQEAASPTRNIPRNIEALLFATYAIAVVSLEEEECVSILGYTRKQAYRRFSTGVRCALHKLGFLVNYDLVTVQALVLWQTSLQGQYDRHACWILNGVVIRLAQKMGMHRDGETMGLPPFETEIRRRVWWAIIMLDAKAALLSGLGHSFLPTAWDTKEPSNLSDADLFPTATEPPTPKEGPTEMVFCLLTYKIASFLVKSPLILQNDLLTVADILRGNQSEATEAPHIEAFRESVAELETTLAELVPKYCDLSAGGLHRMAYDMTCQMREKVRIFSHPTERPNWVREIQSQADSVFAFAVYNVESQFRHYQIAEVTGFLWFLKAHFVADIHAFITSQLCHRTSGPLVDRAWEQVRLQYHYHRELFDMSDPTASSMGVMTLRAWRRREAALTALLGHKPDVPPFVHKLEHVVPPDRSGSNSDSVSMSDTSRAEPNIPQSLDGMRWEPMFGGYVDFANLEWDMFANMDVGSNVGSNFSPPGGPFGGGNM